MSMNDVTWEKQRAAFRQWLKEGRNMSAYERMAVEYHEMKRRAEAKAERVNELEHAIAAAIAALAEDAEPKAVLALLNAGLGGSDGNGLEQRQESINARHDNMVESGLAPEPDTE